MNIVVGYNDNPRQPQSRLICRFYQRGICRFGNRCRNIHCEVGSAEDKAKVPEQAPANVTPKEKPTATARSLESGNTSQATASASGPSTSTTMDANASDRACGICFDTILEKKTWREQTYGLLPNCNHCFCFTCIRKWRQSKEFDFDVSKACPECRKPSDYVYPSKVWFDVKEHKETFISKEKLRMQKQHCKYFNKGSGSCPFGNTCLYLHALPNGKKMDVGPPRPRRRRTSNIDNDMLYEILYWLNDDDEATTDEDIDFDLDLDDPTIAMQYYDHDDIRRYMAIDRLMNPASDSESEDFNTFSASFFL